ncbi:MAG: D-ribose pyranase [Alphaproteobacteria bacterium]|nr:D-ribose pyranase [Alphaproteobacteria bacterium]
MKKTTLLNAPLSAVVARVGHTDTLVLCDAGLPIPDGPERVDLAVVKGLPGFLDVLKALASELQIERIVIAEEMAKISPDFERQFRDAVGKIGDAQEQVILIDTIPHQEFKRRTSQSRAIVRTGECTSYANALIVCGVSSAFTR